MPDNRARRNDHDEEALTMSKERMGALGPPQRCGGNGFGRLTFSRKGGHMKRFKCVALLAAAMVVCAASTAAAVHYQQKWQVRLYPPADSPFPRAGAWSSWPCPIPRICITSTLSRSRSWRQTRRITCECMLTIPTTASGPGEVSSSRLIHTATGSFGGRPDRCRSWFRGI